MIPRLILAAVHSNPKFLLPVHHFFLDILLSLEFTLGLELNLPAFQTNLCPLLSSVTGSFFFPPVSPTEHTFGLQHAVSY